MTKEERIEQLKKGLDNPTLSDAVKEKMRATLHELENPAPKPKRGNPAFQKGKPYAYKKPSARVFTEEEKEQMKLKAKQRWERKQQQ